MGFASLSSGLLARKGQARPAMRPQGFDAGLAAAAPIEDLGWNDMGHDRSPLPAPVLTSVSDAAPGLEVASELALAPEPEPVTAEVVSLPVVRAAAGTKGKAAFTLRLDPVRHLRLRLACALRHQSAQRVVTDALDQFLAGAELDQLTAQAAPHASREQAR